MFSVLYEGKNNGSVAKTPSSLASPPQPGFGSTTSSSALEQAASPKVSHHLCHRPRSFDLRPTTEASFSFFQCSNRQAPPLTLQQQPQGWAIHPRARGHCGNRAGSTVRPGRPLRRRSLQIQSTHRAAWTSGSSFATSFWGRCCPRSTRPTPGRSTSPWTPKHCSYTITTTSSNTPWTSAQSKYEPLMGTCKKISCFLLLIYYC